MFGGKVEGNVSVGVGADSIFIVDGSVEGDVTGDGTGVVAVIGGTFEGDIDCDNNGGVTGATVEGEIIDCPGF